MRCLLPITKSPAILHALDGGYLRPAPGGDLLRNAGRPADRPQSARLRSVPHSERLRRAGRCAPGRAAARAPRGRRAALARDGRDGAVGHRQSEDRGRPDRAGALAAGRGAALRQLRPAVPAPSWSRWSDSAGRASTWSSTLSGIFRDLLPLQTKLLAEAALLAATADEPLEQNFVRKHALGLPGRAWRATSRRRRCACSAMPTAPTAPTSTIWSTAAPGTTKTNSPRPTSAARASPTASTGRPSGRTRCWRSCSPASISPTRTSTSIELGVTTVDHYFDTLGGISRAVRRARGGSPPRSISATRRAATAPCARSPSRWRSRRARARSIRNGTRHAQARLRGRAPDRGARHQHDGLVGDDRRRSRPGSISELTRDLRARRRDARAAGGAQSDRLGEDRQPADRSASNATTGRRTRRCSTRCAARARNSKIGSKALAWRLRHEHRNGSRYPEQPLGGDGEGSVQVQLDPTLEDRHRQGVRGLRQGRHRQEHDIVESVGRLLQARQARAADRLRSQARFDLHADQAAGADRDRRARRR